MNLLRPDAVLRPKRPLSKSLTTSNLRALRKELLIIRADVARMELMQSIFKLKQAVTYLNLLRHFLSSFGQFCWIRKGTAIAALFKTYPLVSSLVSLLLAKLLKISITKSVKPALKWGSFAFAIWKICHICYRIKTDISRPKNSKGASELHEVSNK